MEYTTLGDTGMTVSRLCLGCMSFGSDDPWKLDSDAAKKLIDRAIELGITFFDTANTYSDGESESILGDAISEYDQDELVIATKGRWGAGEDYPNATGLSRKALDIQLRDSLDRLGLDTIDLYQIHRWDDATPIEETLRTLDDAVRRNDVRYIGASSMWTYQFSGAHRVSERLGLERFVSMQPFYNLVYREREREMLPYCQQEGIGVITWSPFARGYLARPHDEFETTTRGKTDEMARLHPYREGGGPEINRRVQELADEKGVTMAQIALAWLLHQEPVTAPIIGTTSIEHLEQAVEALEISLSDADQSYLEEPYEPVRVGGFPAARDRMETHQGLD